MVQFGTGFNGEIGAVDVLICARFGASSWKDDPVVSPIRFRVGDPRPEQIQIREGCGMGQPGPIKRVADLAPPKVAEQPVVPEDDLLPAELRAQTRRQDVLDQDIALVEINPCIVQVGRRDRTDPARRGRS